MKIIVLVAHGKNNEIGCNNKLLWDIKSEMEHFKETTLGKTVIMGANTFLSIGKILTNRKNVIVTTKIDSIDNAEVYTDLISCLNNLHLNGLDEVYIIGGEHIYKQVEKYADEILISVIDKYYPKADKFFRYDLREFDLISTLDVTDNINWSLKKYVRKLDV